MAWPGGSTCTGGVRVPGGGTYWKARYRRSASWSSARSSPGSARALRSEANRSMRSGRTGRPAGAGCDRGSRPGRPGARAGSGAGRPDPPGRGVGGRRVGGDEVGGPGGGEGLGAGVAVGGAGRRGPPASAARPLPRVLVEAVVERLDAELVPGAEQLLRPAVPDREGIHAAELVHH